MTAGIPDDVEQFIADHVHSVEQLEVLLLLHRTRDRAWSAADVARDLRIDAVSAATRLEDLRARSLVEPRGAGEFCYQPPSRAVDEIVATLGKLYGERRVTLINLIFSKPSANIRSFADAFRWRKS